METTVATDHTACQAAHEALYEAAVEAMENPGLMTPRDYLDYRLGTAGHLYHREGWEATLRERDEARAERDRYIRAFNRLEKAVTNHIRDCIDSDGLAHAHRAVMRDLTEKLRG